MDLETWISRQTELINLESKIEKEQIIDVLSSGSAIECQAKGLSLLDLTVQKTLPKCVLNLMVVSLCMKGNKRMPSHKSE